MKDFQVVELGEVAEFINGDRGKNYPSRKEFQDSGIPFINAGHIDNGLIDFSSMNFISNEKFDALGSGKIQENDILYCLRGSLGKTAIIKNIDKGAIASSLVIIRPKEKISTKFLFYFLTSPFGQAEIYKHDNGSSQPNLSASNVKRYKIPLPPIAEQRRIAAILDKADGIRRKRQEAIRLTEELGRSVFLDMFGDPVTNPKGWKIETLDKYISHSNNGLSRRRKIMENEGKIVLRLQDIKSGYIEFSEPNRIPLNESEAKRFQLFKDDLLFVRVNGNKEYVGRCAVYQNFEEDVYHNDHIIRIQFKPELDADFLSFIFNDYSGKKIINSKIKTSAGQYTISQKGIESIEMPIPPIETQKKFKNLIRQIDREKMVYQLALQESENLFNSLLQRAFRGEL